MRGEYREDQACLRRSITQVIQEHYAAMRMPIAMDQNTDVVVLRYKDALVHGGFGQQCLVARVPRALADIDNIMTSISHRAHCQRYDVRICEDVHATRRRS